MTTTLTRSPRNGRDPLRSKRGIILHIGCRPEKHPGSVGMDYRPRPDVDVEFDWRRTPWPLEPESVLTILAMEVIAYVNPADGGFIRWMDECWRVLKPDRQMLLVTPDRENPRFDEDPANCNSVNHQTFWQFDPGARVNEATGERWPYATHEPAPWQIEHFFFAKGGMIEIALRKRADDPEFHADGEIHYR